MERTLNSEDVRYIKCGSNGAFWPKAREEGWIPVGFCEVPFDLSQTGTRDDVRDCWLEAGKAGKTATRYSTELMEFCHLPVGTVFVTFTDRHLWWAEAAGEVIARSEYWLRELISSCFVVECPLDTVMIIRCCTCSE